MKEKLVSVPVSERPLPDTFHARTGHVLPREQSALHHQLLETQQYAKDNKMKVNNNKTKLMLFNNCKKWDSMPELSLDGHDMVLEEEMRLLGVVIRSDMKWSSNTENIVKKGYNGFGS